MKGSKLLLIFMFVLTAVLGAGAIWIGTRLSKQEDVSPEETEAASEQVWNAEIFHKDIYKTYFPDVADIPTAMNIWANTWDQKEQQSNLSYKDALDFAFGDGGRFVQDTAVLTVGDETMYGSDLNYFLFAYYYDSYTAAEPLTDEVVNAALDKMIEESLILQTAKSEGYISELGAGIFNSKNKDLRKRTDYVFENLAKVKRLLVQSVTYEKIQIYYDNVTIADDDTLVSSRSSELSKEEAKTMAKQKMDTLYTKLQGKQITMEEAGGLILADEEVEKLDSAWEQNAYFYQEEVPKEIIPFSSDDEDGLDQKLHSELWSLGEGQMSKVVENESATGYVIIKVIKRYGATDSPEGYDEYLEDEKSGTDITYKVSK